MMLDLIIIWLDLVNWLTDFQQWGWQCDRANAWDPMDLKITLGKWGEDT